MAGVFRHGVASTRSRRSTLVCPPIPVLLAVVETSLGLIQTVYGTCGMCLPSCQRSSLSPLPRKSLSPCAWAFWLAGVQQLDSSRKCCGGVILCFPRGVFTRPQPGPTGGGSPLPSCGPSVWVSHYGLKLISEALHAAPNHLLPLRPTVGKRSHHCHVLQVRTHILEHLVH